MQARTARRQQGSLSPEAQTGIKRAGLTLARIHEHKLRNFLKRQRMRWGGWSVCEHTQDSHGSYFGHEEKGAVCQCVL